MRKLILVLFTIMTFAALAGAQKKPSSQAQAIFSQGYAAGVQSQQSYIQELEAEVERLTAENKALREK